jgi:hypothetical protein
MDTGWRTYSVFVCGTMKKPVVLADKATKLVMPQAVVKRLGVPLADPVLVRYADGRKV